MKRTAFALSALLATAALPAAAGPDGNQTLELKGHGVTISLTGVPGTKRVVAEIEDDAIDEAYFNCEDGVQPVKDFLRAQTPHTTLEEGNDIDAYTTREFGKICGEQASGGPSLHPTTKFAYSVRNDDGELTQITFIASKMPDGMVLLNERGSTAQNVAFDPNDPELPGVKAWLENQFPNLTPEQRDKVARMIYLMSQSIFDQRAEFQNPELNR